MRIIFLFMIWLTYMVNSHASTEASSPSSPHKIEINDIAIPNMDQLADSILIRLYKPSSPQTSSLSPIILFGSIGKTMDDFALFAKYLADQGFAVISFDHPLSEAADGSWSKSDIEEGISFVTLIMEYIEYLQDPKNFKDPEKAKKFKELEKPEKAEDLQILVKDLNLKNIGALGFGTGAIEAVAYTARNRDNTKVLISSFDPSDGFALPEGTWDVPTLFFRKKGNSKNQYFKNWQKNMNGDTDQIQIKEEFSKMDGMTFFPDPAVNESVKAFLKAISDFIGKHLTA